MRYIEVAEAAHLVIMFSGIAVRNFKGFPSLQEVECWGGHLPGEVKVLSLKLYKNSDNSVLAYLSTFSKDCVTYSDYSSCTIDASNSRNSRLRVLLTDLEEGESGQYTCIASVIKFGEEARTSSWSIVVTRNSELMSVCCG